MKAKKCGDCILNKKFYEWIEWLEAKEWSKEYHPGWVQIATKAKGKTTRQIYRDKIMKAYQGGYDDGKE